jgi:putative transposase
MVMSLDPKAKIGAWANDYNSERPHSCLGYATTAEYAANLIATRDWSRNPDQRRRSAVATFAHWGASSANRSAAVTR